MAKKTVIQIDEDKCIGCAKCANSCPGGALAMVNGKAKLVREDFCDGMGVCIGKCPVDAIKFEEVEYEPVKASSPAPSGGGCPSTRNISFDKAKTPPAGGCPSMQSKSFDRDVSACSCNSAAEPVGDVNTSELSAWPIQLHLIRPEAPQFQNADILIAASCSAFSYGSFHRDFLVGRGLVIACPKLDVQDGYYEKLTQMFACSSVRSVTIARMEVPCCSGLTGLVKRARDDSGSNLEIKEVTISLDGNIKQTISL